MANIIKPFSKTESKSVLDKVNRLYAGDAAINYNHSAMKSLNKTNSHYNTNNHHVNEETGQDTKLQPKFKNIEERCNQSCSKTCSRQHCSQKYHFGVWI